MKNRMERVNNEVQKALVQIVRNMHNAYLSTRIFHVSFVDVSPDLRSARVGIVSTNCTDSEKQNILKELTGAKGYIKRELATFVNLKHMPDFHFAIDKAEESAQNIEAILKTVKIATEEEVNG